MADAGAQALTGEALKWRKQAESLQKQLNELRDACEDRTAFEHTGTAMMVIEEDMTISLGNRTMERIIGWSRDELRHGRKWTEYVHPDDLPRMMEYHRLRRERPEAAPASYEFRLRDPSGAVRPVLINVTMVPGTRKSIVSLMDISDRKAAEDALRVSEQRYRDLFENANDIIYVHDTAGAFLDANAPALATYGYSRDELRSITIRDIIDPQWLGLALQKIEEMVAARGPVAPFELLTHTKDRRPVWVEVRTHLLEHEGKTAVQGIARDTTARRAAEEALRASEQRFKETAELLPAIICEIAPDRRFTYVNKLGLQQFGYTAEDIAAGLLVDTVAAPSDRERSAASFREVFMGTPHGPTEYLMRHRDGAERYYLLDSAAIVRDGRPVGLRTCLLDIHERKLAEQRVAESEERFRGVFAGSPIGIALYETGGRCAEANESFRALFGLKAAEAPKPLSALAELSEEHTRQLAAGKAVHADCSIEGLPAGKRCLQWHITPLGQTPSVPTLLLAQVLDVTAQREAEARKLDEVRKAADEARRLLAGMRKDMTQSFTFQSMVSRSPAMRAVFDMLPQIAETPATVLICGESGTGKELVARATHDLSPRKGRPFVAINCSALPDTLLESELFGYKAGAFTDAKKDKPGKFAQAEGGTVFLDEIGDISPAMQVKLLRVLQDRTYEPLGANAPVKADVRIVAATNRDLPSLVKEGKFREDLYYRIKVLQVTLPPLRDRPSDIPLLCEHFVERFNARYGKSIKELSQEALELLLAHRYPGNIRELENVMEHAFVFCRTDTIGPEHLPAELRGPVSTQHAAEVLAAVRNFDELEKLFIEGILVETGGNKLQAAKRLGVHKATLFRKIKRLGIAGHQEDETEA